MKRAALRGLGSIATGLAMAATLPPFGRSELVWVAMVPLLVALWTCGGRGPGWKGFGLGFLAGLTFFITSLEWLRVVSPVGWIAVAAYLSLYPALWGAFAAKLANPWRPGPEPAEGGIERRIREKSKESSGHLRASWRSLRIAFAVAAVWCGSECLRGWVFTGFGWNTLGVAFHETPVMAQAADLLGICGLSFAPVFLQAVLVQLARRMVREARGRGMKPHLDFGVAAVLLALLFVYGVWRLKTLGRADGLRLKVLLVQLNIPQEAARRLWSPEEIHVGYEEETLRALATIEQEDVERFQAALEEGGNEVSLRRPDWVMWPESALYWPVLRTDDGGWDMAFENVIPIQKVQDQGPVTMVLGLNEIEAEPIGEGLARKENARYWNSLVVLSPEWSLQTYRKRHLVIFGEYIPLVDELPFLKAIYEQQSGAPYVGAFSKGDSVEPLPVDVRGETIGVVPSVCFEDTVPRLMRRFVRPGPQLIVNVTNDGWFKQSPAAAQHFANARFRAIELRRPMIRCANTGVSAAVNPVGSTAHPETGAKQELRDAQGNHLTRGWLLAEVDIPRSPPLTLYAVVGDWGVLLLALAGLVAGWLGRARS